MILDRLKKYDGIAIVHNGKRFSFSDISDQIRTYAKVIKNEISINDVVVLNTDYSFYSISLFLALTEFQVIVVPIVDTTPGELSKKIKESSGTKLISIDSWGLLQIENLENSNNFSDSYREITMKNNTGLVLFSSGTTGVPKLMVQNLTELISVLPVPKKQRRLNFLLFLLFDHIGGLNTLINCLNNGSTIIIPNNRNASEIIELIHQQEVHVLPTSPTFLNLMMMSDAYDESKLSSLRLVTYGTERMPVELLKKLNISLPKVKFLQTFGTSETGILRTSSKSSDSLFFKIDDPNREHKVVEGELYIRSKTAISGYKNHDNTNFKEDGWFATGDLVEVDNDGYIKVVGRKNDVINVGGLKVLPSEVETIISQIEGILDCSVYGESNSIIGNMVCAEVVVKSNQNTKEIRSKIRSICRENLEKYKIPNKIIFNTEIKYSNRFKKI